MNPVAHDVALCIGEGRLVRAFLVRVFRAQRIGDYQDLESVERLFVEALVIAHHMITVDRDQIGKRFVAANRAVGVVVRLVEKHARKILRKRRMLDDGFEVWIGELLSERGRREY